MTGATQALDIAPYVLSALSERDDVIALLRLCHSPLSGAFSTEGVLFKQLGAEPLQGSTCDALGRVGPLLPFGFGVRLAPS